MIFGRPAAAPIVAISMAPVRSSWGGSSPFVKQLEALLRRRGYRVQYSLTPRPDLVFMIDPRMDHKTKRFGLEELRAFRRAHPRVPVLHRVNECDQRKGTNDIDELLRQTHELSDFTVFISEWLRDYFAALWFDPARPHACIYNGADPRHFHPIGYRLPAPGEQVRVVTHHWSDNPLKGFDVYAQLDQLIAEGRLPGVDLWVIGRWPRTLQWRAARTFGPMSGRKLADHLRQCHLYITASRWEPCGMHHVEGAQCGLPLLYHTDGGGINEAGEKYGLGFRDDLVPALEKMIADLPAYHARALARMPSGDRMVIAFADAIQRLIAESRQ